MYRSTLRRRTGAEPPKIEQAATDLPDTVRRHRLAAGLTQRDLAGRAGVSLGLLRDLEQARTRRPRYRSLTALLSALGLPVDAASAIASLASVSGPPAVVDPAEPTIEVLGPLTVWRGTVEVPLGSARQRAVLGRLALAANTVVRTTELVDLLWPGTPPRNPDGAVQTHIWRLRDLIDPARPHRDRCGVVSCGPGGYRLMVADDRLDLAMFRRDVRAAVAVAAAEPATAMDLLDRALARWRGRPLADVVELADHPVVTGLLEEQVSAIIGYADLALAAGRPHRVLPWLQQVAPMHPLHEALQGRLIVALALTGRQSDALDAYQVVRRRLADDLGLDPGAELRAVQRRVLRQETAAIRLGLAP